MAAIILANLKVLEESHWLKNMSVYAEKEESQEIYLTIAQTCRRLFYSLIRQP